MKQGITATSAGDLGDVFSGVLGVLSSIPGKHTLLLKDTVAGEHKTKGIVARAKLVIPLAEAQPYIQSCRVWSEADEKPDWHSCLFRTGWHSSSATLLDAHMGHALSLGVTGTRFRGETPWLTCDADSRAHGRVVVNRSPRYNNGMFRWDAVQKKYGKRLLFVGLPEEHRAFVSSFGDIEHLGVRDFLEIARLIRGSLLFIGNQSACLSVAEGLKHPRIAECCLSPADTVYPGDTQGQYVFEGSMILPGFDGEEETRVPSSAFTMDRVNLRDIPPGSWQYRHEGNTGSRPDLIHSMPKLLARDVARKYRLDPDYAFDIVIKQNMIRVPSHFARTMRIQDDFSRAMSALQNAGITNHPVINLMTGRLNPMDSFNPAHSL